MLRRLLTARPGWLARWCPSALLSCATVVLLAVLAVAETTSQVHALVLTALALIVTALAILSRRPSQALVSASADGGLSDAERLCLEQERFDELLRTSAAEFEEQARRLGQRERDLAERLAQFHELLEYPVAHQPLAADPDELIRLSERDREVTRILEAEAERVYEKIRSNGYMRDEIPDVAAIREEVLQLVRRIAAVYSPESTHPLLETSFEQLARAASRICLHTLVLLEQLPLNVQQYSISRLYGYFRQAVTGYGAYQKAAPWITYLSRSLYAGRIMAAGNPMTLGAWWLASEVGRTGAKKLVRNVVDRQAVAIMHDLVTIVGVEVACIFGTGFRQRDPAWQLGVELVELISRFPLSRDSLQAGLQRITALPLKNEYDRIYLYRCLASHRSASHPAAGRQSGGRQSGSHRRPGPAMLTRQEREFIAHSLEQFFAAQIHGAESAAVQAWRKEFEERYDLRLKLVSQPGMHSPETQAADGLRSLATFIVSVADIPPDQIEHLLQHSGLLLLVAQQDRAEQLQNLAATSSGQRFEPPELDPSSPVTDAFLRDLARCLVRIPEADDHLKQLVIEIGGWFRRSASEMSSLIDLESLAEARLHSQDGALPSNCEGRAARALLAQRQPQEVCVCCYPEISIAMPQAALRSLPDTWLIGYVTPDSGVARILLVADQERAIVWSGSRQISLTRERGLITDSLRIRGGTWHRNPVPPTEQVPAPPVPESILVAGSIRGGRFRNYFGPLLNLTAAAPE